MDVHVCTTLWFKKSQTLSPLLHSFIMLHFLLVTCVSLSEITEFSWLTLCCIRLLASAQILVTVCWAILLLSWKENVSWFSVFNAYHNRTSVSKWRLHCNCLMLNYCAIRSDMLLFETRNTFCGTRVSSHCFKSRSRDLGHAPFWGHSSSTVYYFQQWI